MTLPLFDRILPTAHAYTIGVPVNGAGKVQYNTFSEYFLDLVNRAMLLAVMVAILIIIWAAFKYVTSSGDETKAHEAKDMIIGAVVGLALLFLTRLLVPILGITG